MELQQKTFYNRLFITILRVAIGWHFLYEGLAKILQGNWTASGFLLNSSSFLSGFYHWIASSPMILQISDILNMYGLLLIGLALFVGLFSRIASLAGALLLTMYYFAYPPFGNPMMNAAEGHLFIVDKLFIEAVALLFLFFYPEKGFSIDTLIEIFRRRKKSIIPEQESSSSRREALKNLATLPVLGAMGWGAVSSFKTYGVDVMSGATIQVKQTALNELKGELAKGKIGKHEISRLVAGGNLIGGWSHARDLIYADTLFKAYNTEQKVYETLILAEKAGLIRSTLDFRRTRFWPNTKR
jgi:uncharacterized membrane protein YphA (DoxX/SURF4 family)